MRIYAYVFIFHISNTFKYYFSLPSDIVLLLSCINYSSEIYRDPVFEHIKQRLI